LTSASLPVWAETVEVIGSDGAVGAAGISGSPPKAGSPGEDGEAVTATATTPFELRNEAVAQGGKGGIGGVGGDAVVAGESGAPGGESGSGGDALATAVNQGGQFAVAEAIGADGKFSSSGGSGIFPGSTGPNGAAGLKGGDATANATIATEFDASTPFSYLRGSAIAEGGSSRRVGNSSDTGGDANATVNGELSGTGGQSATFTATAEGGASFDSGVAGAATAEANGTANNGSLSVSATATGGRSFGEGDLRQAGDATATASGLHTGSGTLSVSAKAISGDLNGFRDDFSTDIRPGAATATATGTATGGANVSVSAVAEAQGPIEMRDAVSGSTSGLLTLTQTVTAENYGVQALNTDVVTSLTATNPGGGDISATVTARGGDSVGMDPTQYRGGNALIETVHATGAQNVTVSARATPGDGVSKSGDPSTSHGRGGVAGIGSAFGRSTGGGSVEVTAHLRGANDSNLETASVELVDVVDGETTGDLTLNQTARAGDVGSRISSRGDAKSDLTVSRSASSLTVMSEALGGNTEAVAHATNDAGSVDVTTRSSAYLSAGQASGGARDAGTATAHATGVTSGDGHNVTVRSSASYNAVGEAGSDGLTGGRGSDVSSESIGIANGDSQVSVRDVVHAGAGGSASSSSNNAGRGGDASSSASGQNAGASRAGVYASAVGGIGGTGMGNTQVAGRGGDAIASGVVDSTGGAPVTITIKATGGEGGAVGTEPLEGEGRGGDARVAQLTGSTSGELKMSADITGGRGGARTTNYSEYIHLGRGGDAIVDIDTTNTGGGNLTLDVNAKAQDGGRVILENVRGVGIDGASVTVDLDVQITGAGLGPAVPGAPRIDESASLINAVSGETTGVLDLKQTIQGAQGGVLRNELIRAGAHEGLSTNTKAAGRVGTSTESISKSTNTAGWAIGVSEAQSWGGTETLSESIAHGTGDGETRASAYSTTSGSHSNGVLTSSIAEAITTGAGDVAASSRVSESNGGRAVSNAYAENAGTGNVTVGVMVSSSSAGASEFEVEGRGVSTGGGDVLVSAQLYRRGDQDPGTTSLHNSVSGSTTGELWLYQQMSSEYDSEISLVSENEGGGDLRLSVTAFSESYVDTSGDRAEGVLTLGDVVGHSNTGADVSVEVHAGGQHLELLGGASDGKNRVYGDSNGGAVSVSSKLSRYGALEGSESTTELRGGAGRSFELDNYVAGETTGRLSLSQAVEAGSGEAIVQPIDSTRTAIAGDGGTGFSRLSRSGSFESLRLEASATGGWGGRVSGPGSGTRAGNGGLGHAVADAENDAGAVEVDGFAKGGMGPETGERSGNGGDALVELRGVTHADGQSVSVGRDQNELSRWGKPYESGAFGADGGQPINANYASAGPDTIAGGGGHAQNQSFGQAMGDSEVKVFADALGGSGGSPWGQPTAQGGNGGDALAQATAIGAGTSHVSSRARAAGGQGGDNLLSGGEGGNATATAMAQGLGEVEATAIATATAGYAARLNPAAGGVAQATAEGRGASGQVRADAGVGTQAGAILRARVTRDVAGPTTVETKAAQGLALSAFASAIPFATSEVAGSALLSAAPVAEDVDWALSNHTGLAEFVDVHSNVDIAAIGEWHGRGIGGTELVHQETDFEITLLAPNDDGSLVLAIMALEVTDQGFESLDFRIEIKGEVVGEEQTFSDLAQAEEYFATLIDLGPAFFNPWNWQEEVPTVQVFFDATFRDTQSIGFGLAAVVIPEPSTGLLLALGLVVIATRRAQRLDFLSQNGFSNH
jgi:hypothetical protein